MSGRFCEKKGSSFDMVHSLTCISREEGGWADIMKSGGGRVVIVKTIIIYVKLSVWAH